MQSWPGIGSGYIASLIFKNQYDVFFVERGYDASDSYTPNRMVFGWSRTVDSMRLFFWVITNA